MLVRELSGIPQNEFADSAVLKFAKIVESNDISQEDLAKFIDPENRGQQQSAIFIENIKRGQLRTEFKEHELK